MCNKQNAERRSELSLCRYCSIIREVTGRRKDEFEIMTHVHGKIYSYYKLYETLRKQKKVIIIVLKTDRSDAKVKSLIFFETVFLSKISFKIYIKASN